MDLKHSLTALIVTAVASMAAPIVSAAILQSGDLLTITPGVPDTDEYGDPIPGIESGSWFGWDADDNNAIGIHEQAVITPGTAGGLIVGQTQAAGGIDHVSFMMVNGWLYTESSPISGDGTLDLSGLRWSWNGNAWNMGVGAWMPANAATLGVPETGYADGVARFEWSGIYGDSYQLWYSATESLGAAAGCGGCRFFWYLEGTVIAAPAAVPLPAAGWLFGSGLLGLIWCRRKQ